MKKNGFGFVEILFTVAVVIVAALVLYPIIYEAMRCGGSKQTAMKSRGRGIWVAILAANSERELSGQPPVWPGDLSEAGIVVKNAEEYFTYLMSDGTNTGVIAKNNEERIASDLKPSMLIAPGVSALREGKPRLLPENNAWHVVNVRDDSPAEMPFLVSRNVKASAIAWPEPKELDGRNGRVIEENGVLIPLLETIKPFGASRAVWGTKGGAVLDARAHLFIRARLLPLEKPEDAPELKVLPAQGGFQ